MVHVVILCVDVSKMNDEMVDARLERLVLILFSLTTIYL